MKICIKCKILKQSELFYKCVNNKDGLNDWCISCRKNYNQINANSISIKCHEYHVNNKEDIDLIHKEYEELHKNELQIYRKDYRQKTKKEANNKRKKRYKDDRQFRTRHLLRSHLYHALKGRYKLKSVLKLLGYTINEFDNYIESQFLPGMNWNNHGKIWEYDHFYPISKLNMDLLEDQEKCFHYSNYNPRFKTNEISKQFNSDQIGNRNKSSKII